MKVTVFILLFTAEISCYFLGVSAMEQPSLMADSRLTMWADSAYQFIKELNCDEVKFTSTAECHRLAKLDRTQMNIYAAYTWSPLPSSPKYLAVLPDATVSRHGPHNAILTVDPYPNASFGHLILIFLIDYNSTSSHCQLKAGIHYENGDCMTLAYKTRCRNSAARDGRRSDISITRRCEINFLPLVHLEVSSPSQNEQHLQCYHVIGFADCPVRRPKKETSKLICNPMDFNRHRCQLNNEMAMQSRCRIQETCDQAMILSGGWNRDHSLPKSADNIAKFYRMLRHTGFHKNNIKVYYANGAHASQLVGEQVHTVHPSAMKIAFRHHLQKICQSPLCVDSLVIYLNSPTTNDGYMLLWDVDGNGEMESSEIYSLRELVADVSGCTARQVYLFVDQSYAGHLVNYVAQSKHLSNVIVLASGQEDEYSYDSEFTQYWTRPEQNLYSCVTQLHENSYSAVRMSRPTIHDGSHGTIRTSLFGAPCDATYSFTKEELRSSYFGCQNVPTLLWLNRYRSLISDD